MYMSINLNVQLCKFSPMLINIDMHFRMNNDVYISICINIDICTKNMCPMPALSRDTLGRTVTPAF